MHVIRRLGVEALLQIIKARKDTLDMSKIVADVAVIVEIPRRREISLGILDGDGTFPIRLLSRLLK